MLFQEHFGEKLKEFEIEIGEKRGDEQKRKKEEDEMEKEKEKVNIKKEALREVDLLKIEREKLTIQLEN